MFCVPSLVTLSKSSVFLPLKIAISLCPRLIDSEKVREKKGGEEVVASPHWPEFPTTATTLLDSTAITGEIIQWQSCTW